MPPAPGALLSIISWPDASDRAQRVEALVASAGLEPYEAGLAAAKEAPSIVGMIDDLTAPDVVRVLAEHGVVAFAPTGDHLLRVPDPLRARRLERTSGPRGVRYVIETWADQRASIDATDIALLVRAKLRSRGLGPARTEVNITYHGGIGHGMGGVTVSESETRDPRTSVNDVLDVYDRKGARFRVDGSKFSFDVLGEQRGRTDSENADRVALLIAESNPDALVDMAFNDFSCSPALANRLARPIRGPDRLRFKPDPLFELYSPWCFLMHKAQGQD